MSLLSQKDREMAIEALEFYIYNMKKMNAFLNPSGLMRLC